MSRAQRIVCAWLAAGVLVDCLAPSHHPALSARPGYIGGSVRRPAALRPRTRWPDRIGESVRRPATAGPPGVEGGQPGDDGAGPFTEFTDADEAYEPQVEFTTTDEQSKLGGYLTVLGGVLVQITMGSYYSWPSIMVYAPEHLRTPWMMTSTLLANLAFVPLLSPLILRLGPKRSCVVGSQLCALAVFLSSFFVNHSSGLAPFMALYGVAFGASMTMAYSTALPYGWAWFPNNRGVVSGFILGGFGAGSMIFNVVASNLANPDALAPIKGEFSSGIISKFPMVLRKLSLMYSLMAGLGCVMMRKPKITATWFPLYDPDGDKPSKDELKEKLVACLNSRRFITLCIMAWLAAAGGYTVANEYRTFGQAAGVLQTDAHGRDLGVLCAVANGLGRPLWGALVDKFGIAKPWLLLAIMQTGALGTFYTAAISRSLPLYYAATIVQFFCLGGGWAISSTACSRTFGDVANLVFSYVFLGFSFGSATGPSLMNVAGFSLQQTLSFGANLAIISGILGMTYNVNFEGLVLRVKAFLRGCHPDDLEGNICSIQNPYLATIDELGEDDAV